MSMIENQIKELETWRDMIANGEQGKCDIQSEIDVINDAISTIQALSAKLAAANRERSTVYYNDGWIPVEDNLPEAKLKRSIFNKPEGYFTDSVLATVVSEECDGTHTYVATDVMTGSSENEMRWLMSCGYGGSAVYNQKIVAWMPLPEPYRREA